MSDNKLVKSILDRDAATITGIAAGIGWLTPARR